jgi:hypothetical protein
MNTQTLNSYAKLAALGFLAAFLTIILAVAFIIKLTQYAAIAAFCTLQSPTQVENIDNTVTIEPIAEVAPVAPVLTLVPDIKAPIAKMNKQELRAECRVAGIRYGKMTVPQMRQALTALSA